MDWTQTKNVAEANLDAIVGKVSDPKAALTALEKRITGEVAKVEAHLVALDGRVMTLPDLLDEADKTVLKVEAIIAKAKADGRADLAAAASARRQKHLTERAALEAELNGIEDQQAEADTWLTRLQDKLLEVQLRRDALPDTPAPAPRPAVQAEGDRGAPAAASPSTPKPAAPAKPAQKGDAPAKKGDALDDEFAALLGELDVDLSKVELPKKKKPLPVLPDSDDGIPDLVTVADDELPEGEELPPLEKPKGKAAAAKAPAAKAPAAKAAAPAVAKAAAPAVAKAVTPAGAEAPKKKSKAWLWITTSVVVLGGGGAALAHFVFHLF